MTYTITPAPTANAGADRVLCANNPSTGLSGAFSIATGGVWSGGNGTFDPSTTNMSAIYTPTAAEIAAGSVTLTLTTTGNGLCNAATDLMVITFTDAPTANAGPNVTVCANNATVSLNGSVVTATGGTWSGGTGTFSPDASTLNATYTPGAADIAAGQVLLTLTTTGVGTCVPVSDDMTISFTPAPTANAGSPLTLCANNASVALNGGVTLATGGVWSGGLGTFSPNNTALNATYTPTAAELANGTLTLTLTTTGNGTCNPATSDRVITFTPAPVVNAGFGGTVCANNSSITLSGSVSGATGGAWSGGTGSYSPSNTALNAVYTPSAAERAAGSVTLTLTSTGNGLCNPVSSQVTWTISPAPTANAGPAQTLCSCLLYTSDAADE